MFDEFSQCTYLLFVFQVWVRCFQLIGPLVDILHFIFEIADMSIPRIFGHSIALPPRCVPPHTIPRYRNAWSTHATQGSGERHRTRRSSDRAVEFVGVLTTRAVASRRQRCRGSPLS